MIEMVPVDPDGNLDWEVIGVGGRTRVPDQLIGRGAIWGTRAFSPKHCPLMVLLHR